MAETAAKSLLSDPEARFRLLVESVTDYAIFMLDINGVVASWNAGAVRAKGYTHEEIIGSHFSVFYTPEDRRSGLPARALAEAARTGRFENEGWRLRKDGSTFWANVVIDAIRDPAGKVIGFAKVTRDLTERHMAAVALRESERNFQRLVDSVSDYAIFQLDRYGVVTSWNTGAERIKGYRASEIVGRHFSAFYTEQDRLAGQPARALAAAEAEGRFESEGLRVRKDGSPFWANAVLDAIFEDGRLVGFAKITRDITEKKKTEAALRASFVEVEQLTKALADREVLLREVHHRVKNNLQVIGSLLQLEARKARSPEIRAALDDSANRVRAMGLVHDSLYGQENASSIDMQEYLSGLGKQLRRTFSGENQSIELRVAASDLRLDLGVAVPVGLIANEAMTNAFKHAFPGGAGGSLSVELRRDGPHYGVLSIADSGVGGAPPSLDAPRSTGLQIMRALADQLEAEAGFRAGTGTTFVMRFPLSGHREP